MGRQFAERSGRLGEASLPRLGIAGGPTTGAERAGRCSELRAGVAAFVDVEEVEEGLDVVTVGDAVFLFAVGETFARVIAPAALAQVVVPDVDFLVGRFAAVGETPFEDVDVFAAEFHAGDEVLVFHAEEAATATVKARAEIFVVIGGQFALCVETDFVEHATEVDDAADRVVGTAKTGDFHGESVARGAVLRNWRGSEFEIPTVSCVFIA